MCEGQRMTTRGTFSLKGLDAYLEELAQAERDIDAIAPEVLMESGEEVKADMQRFVPKDLRNLENSIVVDGPHRDGNFHYVDIGVITDDSDIAIYGNVQEYGSSSVAAQPYIRPALEKNKNIIRKTLKKLFERMGIKTS